jgi:hypothetical protein
LAGIHLSPLHPPVLQEHIQPHYSSQLLIPSVASTALEHHPVWKISFLELDALHSNAAAGACVQQRSGHAPETVQLGVSANLLLAACTFIMP